MQINDHCDVFLVQLNIDMTKTFHIFLFSYNVCMDTHGPRYDSLSLKLKALMYLLYQIFLQQTVEKP